MPSAAAELAARALAAAELQLALAWASRVASSCTWSAQMRRSTAMLRAMPSEWASPSAKRWYAVPVYHASFFWTFCSLVRMSSGSLMYLRKAASRGSTSTGLLNLNVYLNVPLGMLR